MKQTKDLIGLPVFAVAEGDFVAQVYSAVVNPAEKRIEYLLLEGDQWYMEKKCISFSEITAIGANALTTEKTAHVKPVTQVEKAVSLIGQETNVLNTGVMTRDGRLLGTVSEFFFDDASGVITGCELSSPNGDGPSGIIPAAQIITIGKKYLVVQENADSALAKDPGDIQPATASSREPAPDSPVQEPQDTDPAQEKDPLELFSEKQRQYLIGKKVSKTIIDANGNIVASEGALITEEIIDRAVRVDKYVELTMHVE